MKYKDRIVETMHKVEDEIERQKDVRGDMLFKNGEPDPVLYEVLETLRLILDDRDKMFVDQAEGGSGRESIKKSHRAEGRNFID